jgi:predicted aspartyl protease
MKTARLLLVLGLTAIAATATRLSAEILKETAPVFTRFVRPAAVPAETVGHFLFVPVTINGKGPFHVFIDTGCSYTLISPELAEAVAAKAAPTDEKSILAYNALGDPTEMRRALLEAIELGGVRFEGVTVGVTSLSELSEIYGRRVDGALGFSLFSEVLLGLDYPGKRVLLGRELPKDLPPVRAELAVHEKGEVPFVSVQLQGKTFEVEIDSGATTGLHITDEMAHALTWKNEPRAGSLIAAIGESARDWLGRLQGSLQLGDVEQPEPIASITEGAPSIGVRFLAHFCAVFDQRNDKLWLCANDRGPVASPPERNVGLSLKIEPDGWRIVGITPGSPAEEAYLEPGGLVTQIEGRPTREWTRNQFEDWIWSHDAIALRIKEAARTRDVKLRVWLLVP